MNFGMVTTPVMTGALNGAATIAKPLFMVRTASFAMNTADTMAIMMVIMAADVSTAMTSGPLAASATLTVGGTGTDNVCAPLLS